MKSETRNEKIWAARKADKYWVPVVAKTLDILDCFSSDREQLSLEEVVQRTQVPHTTAYRILHTLASRDYLRKTGRSYRLNQSRKRVKLGFANLSQHIALAVEIQNSLEAAAVSAGAQLEVWDNNRNPEAAVRNAEEMVRSRVDVAVEFQLFEHVAPIISDIFSRAHIPLISIVNPHHGSLYFGVNNYRAGFSAGKTLGEFAARRWRGKPDAVLLLESPQAGSTVQSRLVGVVRGLEEQVGVLDDKIVHHMDSGGGREASRNMVEKFLRSRSGKRILVAGINDESAIGALEAAEQLGHASIAVVGHGGSPQMMQIVADPRSKCIGTVSFHAEHYGIDLIKFALMVHQGGSTVAARYITHEFIGKDLAARRLQMSEGEKRALPAEVTG